ncbi:hypothetical protein DTO169C6_4382 [Paecilomyces variotii]|nr:hypothetical protein DTO169C6_4382 [Paecilomyces variotii]
MMAIPVVAVAVAGEEEDEDEDEDEVRVGAAVEEAAMVGQSSINPQNVQNRDNQNHTGHPRGTDRGRGANRGRGRGHGRRGSRGNQQQVSSVGPYRSLVVEKRPESHSNASVSGRRGKDTPERGYWMPRRNRASRGNSANDDSARRSSRDKGKAPVRQPVVENGGQGKMQHHGTAVPAKETIAPVSLDKIEEPSGTVPDTQFDEIEQESTWETSSVQVEIDILESIAPATQQTKAVDRPIQQKTLLFRLPGELRTKIYEYIFGTYRVCIYRFRAPNTRSSKRQYRLRHTCLPPYHPTIHDLIPRTKSTPSIPSALVYTCREVYRETVLFLYSNTQFVFRSTKVINTFLRNTPIVAQNAIRHLELNYIGYNEPRLTEFRKFKIRSDLAWYLACSTMAQNFISLRVLHLHITIWDRPMKLDLKERWAIPLLEFARKGGLDHVDANLRMHMFNTDQLQEAARKLEKALMNPRTYQIKDDKRLAMRLQGPIRAGKVLNIVF